VIAAERRGAALKPANGQIAKSPLLYRGPGVKFLAGPRAAAWCFWRDPAGRGILAR
jgi:hypothetical protein